VIIINLDEQIREFYAINKLQEKGGGGVVQLEKVRLSLLAASQSREGPLLQGVRE
jgi:hypothetical protein